MNFSSFLLSHAHGLEWGMACSERRASHSLWARVALWASRTSKPPSYFFSIFLKIRNELYLWNIIKYSWWFFWDVKLPEIRSKLHDTRPYYVRVDQLHKPTLGPTQGEWKFRCAPFIGIVDNFGTKMPEEGKHTSQFLPRYIFSNTLKHFEQSGQICLCQKTNKVTKLRLL